MKEFHEKGFVLLRDAIPKDKLLLLKQAFDKALNSNKKEIKDTYFYLAHTVQEEFFNFLSYNPAQAMIDEILSDTCILHSFNGISLLPNFENVIQNKIHRDTQRFCRPYLLSAQLIVMLDDFTKKNGATYILPKSHLNEEKPSDEEFYSKSIQLEGKAGDIVLFDSLCWHAGGNNLTSYPRRALTLVYTRSFMKQQIDLTENQEISLKVSNDEYLKRILGYNVRVPRNIDEFNQPSHRRLYKSNQG